MHDTTLTGPEGNTISLNEALKNGWLSVSARPLDKYGFSYRPIGTVAYTLLNKTTKPLQIRTPGEGIAPGVKTVGIAPGDKQQVTPAAGSPTDPRTIISIAVSAVLLLGGLFVILAKRYQPSDRHWAYATVGTIAGHWLKG